ncbi:hypothetical protein BDV19DRAFT_389554 [Aspergillus venezuelensis]
MASGIISTTKERREKLALLLARITSRVLPACVRASKKSSFEPYPTDSLLVFPYDFLFLIFPLLPFLTQASLAMTCKAMHGFFGQVLRDERLAWPRLRRRYEPPLNEPHLPRFHFLRLLEDEYWSYCSMCLKLHPPRPQRRLTYRELYEQCGGILDLWPLPRTDLIRLHSVTSLVAFRKTRQVAPENHQGYHAPASLEKRRTTCARTQM